MVDLGNTRRRYQPKSSDGSHNLREVRSGGSPDTEDEHGSNEHHYSVEQDKRRRKKKRRRRKDRDEPPFFVLVFQVGAVLFMICLLAYHCYRYVFPSSGLETSVFDDDAFYALDAAGDDDSSRYLHEQKQKLSQLMNETEHRTAKQKTKPTSAPRKHRTKIPNKANETNSVKPMPPLPVFSLETASRWDAFGIVNVNNSRKEMDREQQQQRRNHDFWNAARDLRTKFADTYGGENAARMLLDRGLSSVYIDRTACRLKRAKSEGRPFRFAFGGYSVTTGRGNKHSDSYPYQLQTILEPLLMLAGFGDPNRDIKAMTVLNAAIGGIPSFPYGWCLREFWGGYETVDDVSGKPSPIPDVVSWDFSMNEATGGPEGLEAYIRHIIASYTNADEEFKLFPPKLIVKDMFRARHRRELVFKYAPELGDPVVLHTDPAIEAMMAATKASAGDDGDWRKPPGFRKWREWGAPKGAPGQASHHPAVQEHKLNGWILAMHFVAALEYMVIQEERNDQEEFPWCRLERDYDYLEEPFSRHILNSTNVEYDGILFGHPTENDQVWNMNKIQCRTTFEPKLSGDLSEIVVNGTMGEELDPLLPKSQYYYNKGWTLDLSEAEKKAKRKLSTYRDGLGYKDSKEAYFGIYESPPMTLLLPSSAQNASVGDLASKWYESIVVCQVNDKNTFDSAFADPGSCKFETDVHLKVGGFNITTDNQSNNTKTNSKMIQSIGSVYLGKPICKKVPIPPDARLTSHNELVREATGTEQNELEKNEKMQDSKHDQVGLLLEVSVSNRHIVHIKQACSLSHVIWEERLERFSRVRHSVLNQTASTK